MKYGLEGLQSGKVLKKYVNYPDTSETSRRQLLQRVKGCSKGAKCLYIADRLGEHDPGGRRPEGNSSLSRGESAPLQVPVATVNEETFNKCAPNHIQNLNTIGLP